MVALCSYLLRVKQHKIRRFHTIVRSRWDSLVSRGDERSERTGLYHSSCSNSLGSHADYYRINGVNYWAFFRIVLACKHVESCEGPMVYHMINGGRQGVGAAVQKKPSSSINGTVFLTEILLRQSDKIYAPVSQRPLKFLLRQVFSA